MITKKIESLREILYFETIRIIKHKINVIILIIFNYFI